jgi:hypothetical protein
MQFFSHITCVFYDFSRCSCFLFLAFCDFFSLSRWTRRPLHRRPTRPRRHSVLSLLRSPLGRRCQADVHQLCCAVEYSVIYKELSSS